MSADCSAFASSCRAAISHSSPVLPAFSRVLSSTFDAPAAPKQSKP